MIARGTITIVPDRLYFSCRIRGFDESKALRQFGKMLTVFPYSKLARRGPVLRVYAIEHIEPPLFEREYPVGTDAEAIQIDVGEFMRADCAAELDTFWDLWTYDEDWKLRPVPVTLMCFGFEFAHDQDDHLRIEFGPDARFLPIAGLEGSLRMGQSNLKSLLKLTRGFGTVARSGIAPGVVGKWSEFRGSVEAGGKPIFGELTDTVRGFCLKHFRVGVSPRLRSGF